jgi:hypothetical protein
MIWAADYAILDAYSPRLAVLFGKETPWAKPGPESLIGSNTHSNVDSTGVAMAHAIVRQAKEVHPEAFARICRSKVPIQALQREARRAGYAHPAAFLYGLSADIVDTCILDGPHAMLIALLLGDIERSVLDTLVESEGKKLLLRATLHSVKPDWSSYETREAFCAHYVGRSSGTYALLLSGVHAADLKSGDVRPEVALEAAALGATTVYAAEVMKSVGVFDPSVIADAYRAGLAPEYLAAVMM